MAEKNSRDNTSVEKLEEVADTNNRIEELSSTSAEEFESDQEDEHVKTTNGYTVPKFSPRFPWFYTVLPFIADELETETSEVQNSVAETCRKLMSGEEQPIKDLNSHGIPKLLRQKHVKFLTHVLGPYPSPFQAMDASRPWILYWGLAGLSHLDHDVSKFQSGAIQTFTPLQNATGGFGGGHGQTSHCAASYAATLSLAMVDALHMINRKTMWQWLGSVKQRDGGFKMSIGGEEDVRGAYCAMTIITLLNLPLSLPPDSPANVTGQETFLTGLGDWLGTCQTFEGGIGGAPDNEAHGAYAFCCLACLCIMDAPHRSIPRYLNMDRLLSWLSSRQPGPEGGFSGRTNKLVDACYSHWVGGCWALIEAAFVGTKNDSRGVVTTAGLFNREALVRYTLCCSQVKAGGLRDKPGTRQDGYHTCYSLAGLSAAQNHWRYEENQAVKIVSEHSAAFNWVPSRASAEEREQWAFDEQDTVGFVHPVFVIPPQVVERSKRQFENIVGF